MIRVDRLVLDLPGMTPPRAERLSRKVGALLGQDLPEGTAKAIDVMLPPGGASDEEIVTALAAALRSRGA
jgi:hypothetical protein